ncbi:MULTISPECIES: hypothetical protein [unclassified Synechococcus]|uniref:hypothetical protein n=1 Tax=unclassified Synechococcus TaxID=2626047 RepID=UPI0012EAD3C4|nr:MULTISPECIES: hypothetical protein [unclassified Synechococcus]WFN57922.1 hypothetical protein N4320_08675 [Synechococcus sp. CCFWC 502]
MYTLSWGVHVLRRGITPLTPRVLVRVLLSLQLPALIALSTQLPLRETLLRFCDLPCAHRSN